MFFLLLLENETCQNQPWECTVQSRKSLVKATSPQAQIIQAVSAIHTALHLQHVTDQ